MLKKVVVFCLLVAAASNAQAKAAALPQSLDELLAHLQPVKEFFEKLFAGRSTLDQYTLGSRVPGAMPIYTYESTLRFETPQPKLTVDLQFPAEQSSAEAEQMAASNESSDAELPIITQVDVYLEGSDGYDSQAYVLDGGIGQTHISMGILANNTNTLHYMVIVYGKKISGN